MEGVGSCERIAFADSECSSATAFATSHPQHLFCFLVLSSVERVTVHMSGEAFLYLLGSSDPLPHLI